MNSLLASCHPGTGANFKNSDCEDIPGLCPLYVDGSCNRVHSTARGVRTSRVRLRRGVEIEVQCIARLHDDHLPRPCPGIHRHIMVVAVEAVGILAAPAIRPLNDDRIILYGHRSGRIYPGYGKTKRYDSHEEEPKMQDFWKENDVHACKGKQIFSIDTPPPTLSGKMHMGHAFSYTQGDFIARYRRMQGDAVFYGTERIIAF